jgi:glycosidase
MGCTKTGSFLFFVPLILLPCGDWCATADELTVARVAPPSWWAADESQPVMLLFEGTGLGKARIRSGRADVLVERVEQGSDGRAIFAEVTLAAGAEPGPVEFEIEAGGSSRRARWSIAPRPDRRPDPFGPDDVIYLIMPDRFANGDPTNDAPADEDAMLDRHNPQAYHGGDFRGIRQKLPYLADLGVTAIWLTPVYTQGRHWFTPGGAGPRYSPYHGYMPIDFYDANPRFGSMAEYRELVAEAHRLGLKVIQDQIVGYTGPHHQWVARPPADNWFHGPINRPPVQTFRFDALANPNATDAERRGVTDGWFFGILPDLATRNERVRRYAIQQSLWWTVLGGADGIRLDTYPMVERDFWRAWSRKLKSLYPQFRVVGEAWTPDPALLSFFQGGRPGWDKIDPGIDCVFDFPLQKTITEVFAGSAPASQLAKSFARDSEYPRPDLLVTFLDNHDTPRLAAVPGVTPTRARLAAALLLTARGIPQMTWGDEIGLPGHMDDRRDFPGGWPGDPRDAFTAAGRTPDEEAYFQTWRELLHLRKDSPALRRGRQVELAATSTTFAFLREHDTERIAVVLNLGNEDLEVAIPATLVTRTEGPGRLYGAARSRSDAQKVYVRVPNESVAVLRLSEAN